MIGRIALGGGIAAAAGGLGWVIARRLTATAGPRTFDLTIRAVEHDDRGDLIVLDRTDQTTAPGIYNEVHPKPWRVPYAASRLKAAVS